MKIYSPWLLTLLFRVEKQPINILQWERTVAGLSGRAALRTTAAFYLNIEQMWISLDWKSAIFTPIKLL